MTGVDRLLQRFRARMAVAHVPMGARLLDIGCADGVFLRLAAPRVREAVGIDPDASPSAGPPRIIRGRFPDDFHESGPFDAIALLATLEHVNDADMPRFIDTIRRLLRPGGRVIITVPVPGVDRIVDVLRALHLAHGMDISGHHGYRPEETPSRFVGFTLLRHQPFELGFNHLFVLELPAAS
jgi:SAM-dependent methyltransferase